MDKKLGWSHLKGSGQWLTVLMDISEKWCPSQVRAGAAVFSNLEKKLQPRKDNFNMGGNITVDLY